MKDILLTLERGKIAHLTLNRPHVHNAFDERMIRNLIDCFKDLHKMSSLKALVIRGSGESFCSGADISWMERAFHLTEAENLKDVRELSLMMHLLDTLPVPTITYAHGVVMGGGIGLVACSDIALAAPHTAFSFSETKIGIIPAIVAPYVLRTIGPRQARRYFLTGEKFKASVAHHIGLIHDIVDQKTSEAEVEQLIHQILTGGPQAVRQAKYLIRQAAGDVSEVTRLMTADLLAHIRLSEEGRRGILSFLEKKPPPWIPEKTSR